MEEDGSSYEEQVPLADRPEWAGVEPLLAEQGFNPVVSIQYESPTAELLAYFRRVVANGELSERALALTLDVIETNQADYTAWEWRWRCLRALNRDLTQEYAFTDSIMHDNAKNYQLWNHRRKCALALGEGAAKRELAVADDALRADPKNYHAWAHRQAVVKEFGGVLWVEELAYSEHHLREDLRNNSAWNQRAWIMRHQAEQALRQGAAVVDDDDFDDAPLGVRRQAGHRSAGAASGGNASDDTRSSVPPALQDLVDREVDFAASYIARAPRNDSAWNYLTGLFALPGMPPYAIAMFDEVALVCREALLDAPSCPPAMDTYAQFYDAHARLSLLQLQQLVGSGRQNNGETVALQQAVEAAVGFSMTLLEWLAVADPVRTLYWRHRQQGAQAVLTALTALLPATADISSEGMQGSAGA